MRETRLARKERSETGPRKGALSVAILSVCVAAWSEKNDVEERKERKSANNKKKTSQETIREG